MAGKPIRLDIGTVYQKEPQGNYFFRYQVNKERKAVSLKTSNQKEAIDKAKALVPMVKAPNAEIISAHVKHAKGWNVKLQGLALSKAWAVYVKHPNRATPATAHERESYNATFHEFVDFVNDPTFTINDITPDLANEFAEHMRKQEIAVNTHNRKLRRLRKIFDALKEFRVKDNPFAAKSLFRKEREEQGNGVRRLSFNREQEEQILQVLDDDKYKVVNKPEMRVIYYLGMFTGQRFKDCILLQWDSVNFTQKQIRVKQYKTGNEVTIPIADKLLSVLLEARKWQCNQYVCPNVAERYNKTDRIGKNTGNNLVNIDALRVIRWIGLEPSVSAPGRKKLVTVYGFHSLRHSFASHCAEAGVPKAVVLSILGAASEIIDKYYTHIGDDAQRRAIDAISFGNTVIVSPQDKIDKVLAWIAGRETKSEDARIIEEMLR
jgi:integrase